MKRYVPIIIGVVALCAVLYLGSSKMTSDENIAVDEVSSEVTSKSFQGSFTKMFEGGNTLQYGFDLAETATATVAMDGALINVTESDMPVLAMYISFEGARGYTPEDYITRNIMTKVTGVTIGENKTVGKYDWTVAESANSQWYVASVENGKWLLVVENKKSNTEKAVAILESLAVSMDDASVEISETMVPSESEGEFEATESASTSGK